MTRKQERNIIAFIGTVLFMGFVILLLFLLKLAITQPAEKYDYIELAPLEEIEEPKLEKTTSTSSSAGRGEQGGGKPAPSAANDEQTQKSAEPIVSEEEQLALRAQHEADSIKEDQQKKTKKATDLISSINFGNQGEDPLPPSPKPGPPGPPKGSHHDGIGEWDLDGRELIGGLPQPQCDFTQNAVVVVRIRVNPQGKVVEAEETAGTNISDRAMIQSAVEAAKRSKWNTSSQLNDQVGTIKYTFKIN